MKVDYKEYEDLVGGGSSTKAPLPPELEFFHAVYISGKSRKINDNLLERSGFLQIRGVSYNHDEVYMIITHVKDVLANEVQINGKQTLVCFSFREGDWPWYGTSLDNGKPRMCGKTSPERAANQFCSTCRAQVIISGILCDENGTPQRDPESNNPIFVFIRGKGMKYGNVYDIVNHYVSMDVEPPIIDANNEKAEWVNRHIINHKRFVTKVGIGTAPSAYGDKDVFTFAVGRQLEPSETETILKVAKKVNDKFIEKFDWGKSIKFSNAQVKSDQQFETSSAPEKTESKEEPVSKPNTSFSFNDLDDIAF